MPADAAHKRTDELLNEFAGETVSKGPIRDFIDEAVRNGPDHLLPFDGYTLGYSLAELAAAIRPPIKVARLRVECAEGRLVARRLANRLIVSRTAALAWLNSLPVFTRKEYAPRRKAPTHD